MTPEQRKELKKQAQSMNTVVSIGKNGITENTLTQIATYMKVHKLAKVKLLRTFLDESGENKKDVATKLAEELNAELVQLIGLTVVLYKR
jgi:RNA-binding protein